MSRAKGRVCATCNAWKESPSNYQSPNMGECRLHPPLPLLDATSAWPETKKNDWCEDWHDD